MLQRIAKKNERNVPSSQESSANSNLRVLARKPTFHHGDFKTLEPVNPGRSRVTVDQDSVQSSAPQQVLSELEPYAKIILKGSADKLFGSQTSDSQKVTLPSKA